VSNGDNYQQRRVKWAGAETPVTSITALANPLRTARHRVQPLSPDQERALAEQTLDDKLGPLFHVAIVSGLRQGELFALRCEDVHVDTGILFAPYGMHRVNGKPTFFESKTALDWRTVSLPASSVAALQIEHDRRTFERAIVGGRWQDWSLVFGSAISTPLEPSNVAHKLQALLKDDGLPRQRFHDLRHCSASLLLAAASPRGRSWASWDTARSASP